ncbi:MAG: BlaI/MecI/CopY family transcriptional regulator [Ruminococcaceae bacterium]|nr:BlaI/MecI/CopY family transcriptional regulator [Oscillospiraceae bacterium]
MSESLKRLPDSELAVMQAVWRCPIPATRSQIEKELPVSMAATTVLTLLSRLAEKGYLTVEKEGKSNVYTPTVTQDSYVAQESTHFFRKLCGGSISTFASALCNSSLSRQEIEEIRRLLEEGGTKL